MAVPSNTFQTYQAIGNREDLSDVIYRIDPTDTPCMTAFEREKASAVNHEWQTQALAAVDTGNAVVEGDDATSDAATPSVRLGNLCQISDKVARVSGTQRAVEHAGRDDELEYQETLKGLELKRDMESILVGTNQAKAAGDGTTNPRKTASVLSWIKTNTDKGTAGGAADPAAADGTGTRTDGTQRAFTEAQLKSVRQKIWNGGGKPDAIFTGGFNKQVFSTFTGRATPTEDTKAKKIVASVDFYESDFGRLSVTPNRFMRARDVLVLQTEMWAVAFLNGRRMVSIPLARTGDSERRQMLSEYTLVAQREGLRRRVRPHHVVNAAIGESREASSEWSHSLFAIRLFSFAGEHLWLFPNSIPSAKRSSSRIPPRSVPRRPPPTRACRFEASRVRSLWRSESTCTTTGPRRPR